MSGQGRCDKHVGRRGASASHLSGRSSAGRVLLGFLGLLSVLGLLGPISEAAAEPPRIVSATVEGVAATGASLRGVVNPEGVSTTYRFEYLTDASYEANVAAGRDPFQGATLAPSSGAGTVGEGSSPVTVSQHVSGLTPSTAYRYRLRAVNADGEVSIGVARPFGTEAGTNVFELLDGRGWEMVSPIDKNGGAIQPPGAIFGGGVFQAAAGGGAITYSSADSFGAGAQGAPAGSQYVAILGAGGWGTGNITTPLLSGSYGNQPQGVPYQLFSAALSSGLLSNGERCRGEAGGECPVANPPLPGSDAPAGYRDYYRRTASGGFESVLNQADLAYTGLGAAQFEMRLVAATPELDRVIVSSCAALAPGATEVPAPGGCDAADQNLYEWAGGNLTLVNFLPGQATGTPGATIGASSGAVSADGSRIYFRIGNDLYLRQGGETKLVDASLGVAEFEGASTDGGTAYLLDGGNLLRYTAGDGSLVPLTSSGDVEGVLGVSSDGSRAYYAEPAELLLLEGSSSRRIAGGVSATNWPPATGTARVSADGNYLLFTSEEELTEYPNAGKPEVFIFGSAGAGGSLVCVSCDPTGELPTGGASIPGAVANGTGAGAFAAYKPRVLSADGRRVFFDSADSLVPQDTNGRPDVYEWEAQNSGTCAAASGCVQLISTGRSDAAATFLDASADGSDAYFLTAESIYPLDPGSYDVYDARIGGSFAVPAKSIPCVGDACQALPEAPEDPTPGTLTPNSGNPPLQISGEKKAKKKKHHTHKKSGKNKKKNSKATGHRSKNSQQKPGKKGGR